MEFQLCFIPNRNNLTRITAMPLEQVHLQSLHRRSDKSTGGFQPPNLNKNFKILSHRKISLSAIIPTCCQDSFLVMRLFPKNLARRLRTVWFGCSGANAMHILHLSYNCKMDTSDSSRFTPFIFNFGFNFGEYHLSPMKVFFCLLYSPPITGILP